MKLSSRVSQMQESPVRKLVPYAEEAKKKGKTVYHLNIGQPDIKTPDAFKQHIYNYLDKTDTISYSKSAGEDNLIDAIVEYFKRDKINITKEHVIVTSGGSEGLFMTFTAMCDAGDEILVPEPFYTNYSGFSTPGDVKIKPIVTSIDNGFKLPSLKEIEKLITPKTKAFLISNPSNPTGVVYSDEELQTLVTLAIKHDLYIVSDEVYRKFSYDSVSKSFLEIPEVSDKVIIIDSVSKRYSACGARIGCVISRNKTFIKGIFKIAMARLCVSTLEQVGAEGLYRLDESYIEEMKLEYQSRRDAVYESLSKIDGVVCNKPNGAFYIIAKLPIENSEDFVKWMLTDFDYNNETVMFSPAEGFYATDGLGKDEIRIAYVLDAQKLAKCVDILDKALKQYNKVNG